MTGVREVGTRIEELLGALSAGRDKATAEELVRLLVDLYGRGLEHVVEVVADHDTELLGRLADDKLVASLLLVHGLHPLDVDTRIQRALDQVRPYLGSHAGGVEYLGVDDAGVAHLKLAGSCDGCPSSTLTVQLAIQGAVEEAAPEVASIEVEGVREPEPATPLLQIGSGPPDGWAAVPAVSTGPDWVSLPDLGPPTSQPVVKDVDGLRVLVCSVRGTLFAYRDVCASCGSSLAEAVLDGQTLRCAQCAVRYDIRLAGKGIDDPTCHLDPLPLITDSQGVRVALPKAAVS